MRALLTLAVLSASSALAASPVLEPLGEGAFVVPDRALVDRDAYDLLLERATGEAPPDASSVTLYTLDGAGALIPAESLFPEVVPPPRKDGEPDLRSWPADNPGAQDGFLTGKAIYLSQCHGYIWYDTLTDFSTQRGEHFDTVEDFHNPEGLNQFLAPYLENAGAGVFAAKERDINPQMAIADNDGEGYSEAGSGFVAGNAGFKEAATWASGTNPFASGTTRKFPANAGAKATWIPEVPADGLYSVYVSWDSDATHARDAHYKITHPGGTIDRVFDQRVHGSTWQYVETLWLPQGVDGLTVELIGDSAETGKFLSADAVRIGGGVGDVVRNGETTGRPRWEEGAQLYTQFNGAPSSIYNQGDVGARSRWAAWEHPSGEDALYLSWHSNACGEGDGCTARGTVTYIYGGADCTGATTAIAGSYDLAYAINDELVSSFRTQWDAAWPERGTNGVAEACFGEVDPDHNNEMPSALVELAFHNNETDAGFLKEPEFRRDAARAMYRGIVRYYAERDGVTPKYLPEPPTHLAVTHASDGNLKVSWQAGPTGDPFGDAPTGYLVYTSKDGRSWSNGTAVTGTTTTLDVLAGPATFVRVSATNDGGTSFPSEVVGARRSPEGAAPILVVAAFDRLDAELLPWDTAPRVGSIRRMWLPRVNPFDTAAVTGRAIEGAGYYFDIVSDEAFDDLDLGPYDLVVWVAGEESTVDETFTTSQQAKLRAFHDDGGALWASGSEVLWDLDFRGDTADKAFAHEVLGATFASDDAGSDIVTGEGVLDGAGPLDFAEADGAGYPVEFPDTLTSTRDIVARYGGSAAAGVLGDGVFFLAFPFEAIGDDAVRAEVARRLLPGVDPPDPPDPPDTGGEDWVRHEIPAQCGCSSAPGALSGVLALLPLVVAVRRRRLSSRR